MNTKPLVKMCCVVCCAVALMYVLSLYSKKQENFTTDDGSDLGIEEEQFDNHDSTAEGFEDHGNYQELDDAQDLPKDCFPKDQLTPGELLPGDSTSKWSESVPKSNGELGDQNFLTAGHHVGVNTVGQSLRNANRQLRSDPPNPQVKVSPWLQTTIEADTNRKPLEIGGCN